MSASLSLFRSGLQSGSAFTPPPLYAPASRVIDGSLAYDGDVAVLHAKLVRLFEESEHSSYDARAEAERARDYYDGKQYTAEEVAILRRRRQPIVVNNYVKRKIDLLRGIEMRGRSDPKAFPRTPDEDNRADAATQALRYVGDDQRFDVIRSQIASNLMIEGYGGCEVIAVPNRIEGGYDVNINYIAWDRLFHDSHSRHPAFTDSTHQGVVIWQNFDDALAMFPGREDVLHETLERWGETYADKPEQLWCDGRRKRVMTVQHHWKEREDWYSGIYTRGGWVEDPARSPYPDRHGNATCPLIMRSCYVDRDGNRYGLVKDLISPQDSINKRESKLAHSLSVNRIVMEQGAVADEDKARVEAAKPDGVIVVNPQMEFRIEKDTGEIAGHFQLLQHAVQQMNVSGPNASMAGKDPREQSGRAIIAQQSGGQLEFEPVADAIRQHTRKVYEAVWMRIKQFWTAPKWIRITDDDKAVKFVGLNRPVTLGEELSKMDPAKAGQIVQQLGLAPGDPRLEQVVRVENELGDIDCDIDIEEGPDSPTMAAEQFVQIMQLPPNILANFPPAFFIKASSLRNKDALIDMLEKHGAEQAKMAADRDAIARAGAVAQVGKTEADAADKRASAVQRLHGVAADYSGANAPPDNGLLQPAPPVDPLAAADQAHSQMMDRSHLALDVDQQFHEQNMDRAAHGLAVQQATAPPAPAAPAPGGV